MKVLSPELPLSRQLLRLLLIVYCLVIFLHRENVYWWMLLSFIGISLWRVNIQRQQWRQPRTLLKILLVVLSFSLVLVEYRQLFAFEPMLMMLLFALGLKIMELRYRRDYVLVLFLSCFIVACSFLFKQSILHSLSGLLTVVFIIVALLQVHYQWQIHYSLQQSFSLAIRMLLQSMLLMVVLMLVIPRIAPLWSVPLTSGTATSGISDSMAPGDFDQLIRSNELAFRLSYIASEPLAPSQLAWFGV